MRSHAQTARAGHIGLAYTTAVILAGAAVLTHSAWSLSTHPVSRTWIALLVLTVASGLATLRVPGMPISFSISDIFSIGSALAFGPSAGAVTAAVDGLVLSSRMAQSQRSLLRLAFNASAPALAIWIAAHASSLFYDSSSAGTAALWWLVGFSAFGGLDYLLNTWLVAVAVALERGLNMRATWLEHFAGLWPNYVAGVYASTMLLPVPPSLIGRIALMTPLPLLIYFAFRNAVGRTQDHISHLGNVNRVYVGAIEALAHAVDARDQVTHDHVRRVQDSAVKLARALGVDSDGEIQAINAAALLHDVGKLAIPEHILNKPGPLTPAEFEIMKRHAPIGADILAVIDFPYPVAPIVRHHHENWDGSGYPDRIAGAVIPIGSRILAVVDCFDALTSDRPYRPRMPDREALDVLASRKATMYDPAVVDAFFAMHAAEPGLLVGAPQTAPTPGTGQPAGTLASRSERSSLDLVTFFELGRTLGGRPEDARTGVALHARLRGHLPRGALVLYVYDSGSDAIVAAWEAGDAGFGALPGTRIPVGERLSGWVAATGEPVRNSDARLDLDEQARERSPFRSTLAVRLADGDRVLGVLAAYASEPNAFDDRHACLIEAAGAVLVAIGLDRVWSVRDLSA